MRHAEPCQYDDSAGNANPDSDYCSRLSTCPGGDGRSIPPVLLPRYKWKMGPFPCPECSHQLQIQSLKITEIDGVNEVAEFDVEYVQDHTLLEESYMDPSRWAGVSRRELIRELQSNKRVIDDLQLAARGPLHERIIRRFQR